VHHRLGERKYIGLVPNVPTNMARVFLFNREENVRDLRASVSASVAVDFIHSGVDVIGPDVGRRGP
jgi:hypothetical protein